MKYVFYQIGVNGSNLDEFDIEEQFSMNKLKLLPDRHKRHMVEILRIMADSLDTGILSNRS